ncbi:hypothetical protein MMC13_005328 [Lambiella insularis]|nr:hypothetical protein [Lambiella insularis]
MATSSASAPLKKKASIRDLHQSVITVKIRDDQNVESFIIHKELLGHYSAWFRSRITEAKDEFNLTKCSPQIFRRFEHWLYRQTLEDDGSDFFTFANLYILGEKFGVPNLQNAATNMIFKTMMLRREYISFESKQVSIIWEYTKEKSPLRRLLVDLIACNITPVEIDKYAPTYPTSFVIVLLKACVKRDPNRPQGERAVLVNGAEHYLVEASD